MGTCVLFSSPANQGSLFNIVSEKPIQEQCNHFKDYREELAMRKPIIEFK